MPQFYWLFCITISLLLASKASFASDNKTTPESDLYFMATDKQVKLLNQKLEYRVHNTKSIQLGNLLISTDNLKLSLKDENTAVLQAPLQFMIGGMLILKDPHGRALWSQNIADPATVEMVPKSDENMSSLRSDSARYYLTSFADLRETLMQSSFFSLCAFTETKTNRIQVCTPNYSLNQIEGKWELQTLDTNTTENVVIVNGTEVNEHGIIQFDQNIKSVSIAAKLSSGLSVEVKTDFIDLDLLDIYFDEPQALVHLKLREKRKGNKKIYPWKSQISIKDPFLYIEAFGQAPLRQELAITKDELPLPSDRPVLLQNFNKTYLSSLNLTFQDQPTLSLKAKTKGDTIKKEPPLLTWTLNNLKVGINKPHLISIGSNNKNFVGAYEVERSQSWDLALNLGGGSDSRAASTDSHTHVQLIVRKYFETFLGNTSPSHHLRWGTHLEYGVRSFNKSKTKSSTTGLDLSYRLEENFHHNDPSWSLRLGLIMNTLSGELTSINSQRIGLKLTHDGPNTIMKTLLGTNHETHLAIFPVCLSEACKNSTLFNISWQSRYDFREKYFWNWKALIEQSQMKQNNESISDRLYEVQLGLGMQF